MTDFINSIILICGICAGIIAIVLSFKYIFSKISTLSLLVYSLLFGFSYYDAIFGLFNAISTGNWDEFFSKININPIENFDNKIIYSPAEGVLGLLIWGFIYSIAFSFFFRGMLKYFFKDKKTPKSIYINLGVLVGGELMIIGLGNFLPNLSKLINFPAFLLPLIFFATFSLTYFPLNHILKDKNKQEVYKPKIDKNKKLNELEKKFKKNNSIVKSISPISEEVDIILVMSDKDKKFCEVE